MANFKIKTSPGHNDRFDVFKDDEPYCSFKVQEASTHNGSWVKVFKEGKQVHKQNHHVGSPTLHFNGALSPESKDVMQAYIKAATTKQEIPFDGLIFDL